MNELRGIISVRDFGATASTYRASAMATAESDLFILDNIGDFKVGDQVLLLGGVPRVVNQQIFPRTDTSNVNPRPPKRRYVITDEMRFIGYTGPDSVTYTVDIYPESPDYARWTKDNGATWVENVPIVDGVIEIENGCKLITSDFEDKKYGITAVFSCASKCEAQILAIKDNQIRLSVAATKTEECSIMHSDSAAIQKAVDLAIKNNSTVYFPNGKYRLTSTIAVKNADSLAIVGESGKGVIIDNSDMLQQNSTNCTNGACFSITNSKNVSIKSLTMIGNMGYDMRHLGGCNKSTKGVEPTKVYGFYFNYTSAVTMSGVEHVLIEDCHARKMSGEAFYAKSEPRTTDHTPEIYQKSITYRDCSVEDSARNAFNNNDCGENTSVINCRIVNVGGCAWEGSSRFVKITGNYIRSAGPIAIGNLRSRDPEHERLGTAQHVVADNVIEGGAVYGSASITVGAAAAQVIIKNNTFINHNSNAILLIPHTQFSDLPPEHVIVSGNSIDLTAEYSPSVSRYGIRVGCDYATVSDNQIFTRGPEPDENVSCIEYVENSANTIIHSNTLSYAGTGISVEQAKGFVGVVVDEHSFFRREPMFGLPGLPPVPRRRSHNFREWIIKWENGECSQIECCNAETKLIKLKKPRKCTPGEAFTMHPPKFSVLIRSNLIAHTLSPIKFEGDSEGRVIVDGNLTV